MRTELGFEPAYTTAEALEDFGAPLRPTGGRTERLLAQVAKNLPEPDPTVPQRPVAVPSGEGAEHG